MYHDLGNNIIKFVEGFKCLGNASYGYIPVSLTVNGLTRYF